MNINDVLRIAFNKAGNDIACLLITRENLDGSLTMLKEFNGEEAEGLYNFLSKPVVLPIKEEK